jgi:hypothetical protein
MNDNRQTISRTELENMTAEELAEKFKRSDLEVCLEPLSEWGSDLETLFQKLEKGVMQWYEAGLKRSFTICFLDEAPAEKLETPPTARNVTAQNLPVPAVS